jgi:hypothetical protein
MSAQHTPGPWQRSGVRVKLGAEDCLQVGPDSFAIAFLPIGNRPKEQAGAIADACLIAAAPDMLKALQAIAELPAHPMRKKAVELARDAIAKATGSAA